MSVELEQELDQANDRIMRLERKIRLQSEEMERVDLAQIVRNYLSDHHPHDCSVGEMIRHSHRKMTRQNHIIRDMLEVLETIENDGNQVPPWLWAKIQTVIKKAGGQAK